MSEAKLWCEACGTPLPPDARFCEMCGAAVPSRPQNQGEMIIGHLPAERVEKGKGLFGRASTTQLNLVITTVRLLYLRETDAMNQKWLAEEERLGEEQARTGQSFRAVIDSYDWRGSVWAELYEVEPDELLAAHRENEAIPLTDILSATVTLDEELDKLDISLVSGETHHFQLFNLVGRPAAQFLRQALGPDRVRLVGASVA